jgi:predicted nucleic acid-binding protein
MSCIIDTNIWLYAFLESQDPNKSVTAKKLIMDKDPVLSVQIINEVCVNLIRKAKVPEGQIRAIASAFYDKYHARWPDRTKEAEDRRSLQG